MSDCSLSDCSYLSVLMSASRRLRLPVLLVLAAVFSLVLVRCDALGSSDDDDDPATLAGFWSGSYDGTGAERDYQGNFFQEGDIQPSLDISVEDENALDVLQLEWDNGNAVIRTSGPLPQFTSDTLVTRTDTVTIQDTVETWFRFQLGRLDADSTTVDSIDGEMRQYYEDGYVIDSTVVRFTVDRN